MDLGKDSMTALIARFMGPTWGLSGADRTQMGPMLAPWTLLSGCLIKAALQFLIHAGLVVVPLHLIWTIRVTWCGSHDILNHQQHHKLFGLTQRKYLKLLARCERNPPVTGFRWQRASNVVNVLDHDVMNSVLYLKWRLEYTWLLDVLCLASPDRNPVTMGIT